MWPLGATFRAVLYEGALGQRRVCCLAAHHHLFKDLSFSAKISWNIDCFTALLLETWEWKWAHWRKMIFGFSSSNQQSGWIFFQVWAGEGFYTGLVVTRVGTPLLLLGACLVACPTTFQSPLALIGVQEVAAGEKCWRFCSFLLPWWVVVS